MIIRSPTIIATSSNDYLLLKYADDGYALTVAGATGAGGSSIGNEDHDPPPPPPPPYTVQQFFMQFLGCQ
jgi:hypothetical protein